MGSGIRSCANARGQGIARVLRHVGDGAALHAIRGARRTFQIRILGGIAIVARIGKDDAADGTMLLREFWLRRAW